LSAEIAVAREAPGNPFSMDKDQTLELFGGAGKWYALARFGEGPLGMALFAVSAMESQQRSIRFNAGLDELTRLKQGHSQAFGRLAQSW
jgi:hypothetical protein